MFGKFPNVRTQASEARHTQNRFSMEESMWKKTTVAVLMGFSSPLLFLNHASACDPHAVCLDIQWCMTSQGREYATPIRTAASKGDGNGVGVDTAACQHKYGTRTQPVNWNNVSRGCSNVDYAAIAKKALGGSSASCD
jgi:hypothetical protein